MNRRRWNGRRSKHPTGDEAAYRLSSARKPSGFDQTKIHWQAFHCRDKIQTMSTVELRRRIKKAVDQLPPKQLASLDDYVRFLNRPALSDRLADAEKAIASGKGVNWRKVRSDV